MMRAISRSRALLACAMLAPILMGCGPRRQPFKRVGRLSDGTVLKLETATYGKQHRSKLRRGGIRGWLSDATTGSVSTDRDALVIWFSQPGSESGRASSSISDWAVATDEHGCRFVNASGSTVSGWFQSGSSTYGMSPRLYHWLLETFPRRGRTVTLRFFDQPGGQHPTAEFSVPNPVPGPHPTWVAEPYPITKRDGDLECTLVSLWSPAGGKTQAIASFRITQNGRPTQEWEPVAITVSDATGNTLMNAPGRFSVRSIHKTWLQGLCPYEPAWKLQVEFAPTARARLAPDQRWNVRGVPIPGRNAIVRPMAMTSRNGATLQLLGIAGAGTVSWSEGSISSTSEPYVRLEVSPKSNLRPTLRATDGAGREIVVSSTQYSDSPNGRLCEFALGIPPHAKMLDLTFAVHTSRFAEFTARPSHP